MKGLIIYSSKHGTTEYCAKKLKENLNSQFDIINIKNVKTIDINNYSKIIIGTSVYAGAINKDLKAYVESNKAELLTKDLGIFMCCMSKEDKANQQFKDNFSEELLKSSKIIASFGGEFKFSKMNFFEKTIIKIIAKNDPELGKVDGKTDINKINENTLKDFSKIMEE